MANTKKEFKELNPKSQSEFRKWLTQNHTQSDSVWVVIYKKGSGHENLSASQITDEALCFGWIDSVPRKRDDLSYRLLVSPRKKGSPWSAINKEKVGRLIKSGKMTAAGLEKIERAKKDGTWTVLEKSDRLEVPKDLKVALSKAVKAKLAFEGFAPSSKRAILEWINLAKTPETRSKRVSETVRLAAKGLRANHYRDKEK